VSDRHGNSDSKVRATPKIISNNPDVHPLMVAAVCLVIGLRTQQDADGRPSDDLRLPAGPAVARRAAVGTGPGPDAARAGYAGVGAGPVRAY
jgi:hypothetical protein